MDIYILETSTKEPIQFIQESILIINKDMYSSGILSDEFFNKIGNSEYIMNKRGNYIVFFENLDKK